MRRLRMRRILAEFLLRFFDLVISIPPAEVRHP